MPVYVSTTSFPVTRLVDIFDACRDEGIDAIELSAVAEYDEMLWLSSARPRYALLHNYAPPPTSPFVLNLMARDTESLRRSVAHCERAIDMSARVEAPVYAAHPGYLADLAPGSLGHPDRQAAIASANLVPYSHGYETLVRTVTHLADYAARRNVRFLVENHVLSTRNGPSGEALLPFVRQEEFTRLAADVDRSSLGFLVDVGHLNVTATTLGLDRHDFIDALGPRLAAFHLSDNDGVTDQHRSFDDGAWFLPRLRDFPAAVVTIELSGASIEDILRTRDVVSRWQ